MGETRRKFDQDFREGAVRLVRETGKPIAQVARELGIVPGTLENWVAKDRRQREGGDGRLSEDERAELVRLRRENAELAMRCDVLKRSGGPLGSGRDGQQVAVAAFIAAQRGRSRHPGRGVLPGAGGVPARGTTSGRTVTARRGGRAGSG